MSCTWLSDRSTSVELIPEAQVLRRESDKPLPARVLVNGAGEYLIEILGIAPESELFVRVRAARDSGPFITGNYDLGREFLRYGDSA